MMATATDASPVLDVAGGFAERGHGRDRFRLDVPPLRLAPGRTLACIGPSGCGKTTLLQAVTGILPVQGGACRLAGRDLVAMNDVERRAWRLRHVGMVFQDFALLEALTVRQNILLPARLAGLSREEARERAGSLAARLGVDRLQRRRPHRLSQGERQRVAICRALIARPSLLACDEPTGNLDPARARSTIELIRERAAEIGAATLIVTHDHGLLDLADEVLDMGATS